MRIGLIKEGKLPPDSRVALSPPQCKKALELFPELQIAAESSSNRCFTDQEYEKAGITVQKSIADCDILLGIKEVPTHQLIPQKTYLFFSHTIKEQPYNRGLLQAILKKNIRLIDYEVLNHENGARVLGFGRFAGIVGAHNGLLAYGKRTGSFTLKPAHKCKDYEEVKKMYEKTAIPPMKIVVTGGGRVAKGAMEVLELLQVKRVEKEDFLDKAFDLPVYVQLHPRDMYIHSTRKDYDQEEFYSDPSDYISVFAPYAAVTDLMINAIFWDPRGPVFFTKEDMRQPEFSITSIADITCDICGSVPATLRSSTIEEPVYGYDPVSEKITRPFQKGVIDIMAVDNLPNELPRDASEEFGESLIHEVIPEFFKAESPMLKGATIAENGKLTELYSYLQDYVEGK